MKLIRLSPLVLVALAITFTLAVRAQAQTVTFLADFDSTNGSGPVGSVVQATDGNFYGYAALVFRATPSGELTAVYDWCSENGSCPFSTSGPILGVDGNLYGVTSGGGVNTNSGTFYKLTLDGKLTTLYTFCVAFDCAPGPNGIILASDGNFYGSSYIGQGSIFRISPTGEFKLLYLFCSLPNCADGEYASAPPIQATNGNLYGTANGGGAYGGGVIYELTPSGTYTVIRSFCNFNNGACPDGSFPSSIVQNASGNFFGATTWGGSDDAGTFFEITTKNEYLVLHNFERPAAAFPGKLTLASDGNFYGVASGTGRDSGQSVFFELTPTGVYTSLYTFECCTGGYYLNGPPLQATNGSFYGTTSQGPGHEGEGTVFELSTGLGPLVETVPVGGTVGSSVLILGNGLTGSTSVKFNGVAAAFTVESDTYINATVPKGATTGTVSVVTPSGTLNSNPQFVVSK
jgi:uncharacterized repeat protein (TIGR03803 family)